MLFPFQKRQVYIYFVHLQLDGNFRIASLKATCFPIYYLRSILDRRTICIEDFVNTVVTRPKQSTPPDFVLACQCVFGFIVAGESDLIQMRPC